MRISCSGIRLAGIIKLLPLQGDRFASVITQGDALGRALKKSPFLRTKTEKGYDL